VGHALPSRLQKEHNTLEDTNPHTGSSAAGKNRNNVTKAMRY
jgi:hypothetical protein